MPLTPDGCSDSCTHTSTTLATEGAAKLVFHLSPTTHELVQELFNRVTSMEERLARMERALLRPESDR